MIDFQLLDQIILFYLYDTMEQQNARSDQTTTSYKPDVPGISFNPMAALMLIPLITVFAPGLLTYNLLTNYSETVESFKVCFD